MRTVAIKNFIIVRSSFVGFHRWPAAPQETEFLRSVHRHKFNVEFHVWTNHHDRSLEFFAVQAKLQVVLTDLCDALRIDPSYSCERMASFILNGMEPLGVKAFKVIVDEDGENAGGVEIQEVHD